MSNIASNNKKAMIEDISVFSAGTYLAQFAYCLRGFLNASILGPAMYGLWSALNIISSLGFYSPLGVLEGMYREVPYSIGKGDPERAERAHANAFSFSLFSSILVAVFIIAFALFFRKSASAIEVIGLIAIAVMIIIQNMVNFYEIALSADKRFSVLATASSIFPIVCVALTLLFVPKWKIYGVYMIAILGPLLMVLFYYFVMEYKPRLIFDIKEAARLIKIGLPWMSLSLLPVALFAIDRALIFKFMGAANLGYYALGLLICRFLNYLPGVVARVVEPQIFHTYGKSEKAEDLAKYLFVPSKVMAVCLPLFIGTVYFVSSFVIRHFMREYIPSLTPVFILLFGKFFLLYCPTTTGFFVAVNKQRNVVYFYIVSIALTAILDITMLRLGLGLNGIAFVTCIVNFLLGTSLFIYSARLCSRGWLDSFKSCLKLYMPYLYVLMLALGLDFMFKGTLSIARDLLVVLLSVFVLFLGSLPFMAHLNKQIRLFEEIRALLKSKLGISLFRADKLNGS
ncbi:MAG: oligosaccharide flippase family protein [Candidatus Omnitrophota bacterium]|nr:oligosaccharide flippase family protein [Candidatus Omnitrophota bacterium]